MEKAHVKQPNKAVVRKERAAEREDISSNQTPKQRLDTLDNRLGKDKGAVKERARLNKLIQG